MALQNSPSEVGFTLFKELDSDIWLWCVFVCLFVLMGSCLFVF